jgi:hypothetical protein
MTPLLIMAAQAAAPAPAPVAIDFDVRTVRPAAAPACGKGKAGEIVVCGRDDRGQRLALLPQTDPRLLPKAEIGLGGGTTLNAHVDRKNFNGAASNRAMVTLSVPF